MSKVITIKKLKKDGLIDTENLNSIITYLSENRIIIMPIDFIHGFVCVDNGQNYDTLVHTIGVKSTLISRMVSTFKMLEGMTLIGKLEFDFLHRIWPGEMLVYLKVKESEKILNPIPIRMPKGRLCQEIIGSINKPLLFCPLCMDNDELVYQKKSIISQYKDTADLIVIIDEFCKEHTLPTVLDISNGDLKIINVGRISSEEIKSLYFLGRDDITET
jgi:tRNA A37 threonylcarbamoyladenosine synthetase subunit TsaC/SUA5/YrdC